MWNLWRSKYGQCLFIQARVRNSKGVLVNDCIYTILHFERTTEEYNFIFDKVNFIHTTLTGHPLMAHVLVTDSEMGLVNACSQKIDCVTIKNCLFHFEKNTRSDFRDKHFDLLESNLNFQNLYYNIRGLPFLPPVMIVPFLDFLEQKFQNMILCPNQDENSKIRIICSELIKKYRTRFTSDSERLSWFNILYESESYIDLTTNTLERSNQEFRKAIRNSRKNRCIDRILSLKSYIYFRSIDFLNNFEHKTKKITPESKRNFRIRKAIVTKIGNNLGEPIDNETIFRILIGDLY